MPPERKTIPGTDGRTLLLNAIAVLKPTSSAVIFSFSGNPVPQVTMFGFKSIPSKKTWLSARALKTVWLTRSVAL